MRRRRPAALRTHRQVPVLAALPTLTALVLLGGMGVTGLRGAAPAADAGSRVPPPLTQGIVSFRLENGLDLVVAQRPDLPLAAVNLTVAAGAADDPPGAAGMAHLIEHLSLTGTLRQGSLDPAAETAALASLDAAEAALAAERRRPGLNLESMGGLARRAEEAAAAASQTAEAGDVYGARLESLGAVGMNAVTSSDTTQFFCRLPSAGVGAWLALEADRLRRPLFRNFLAEKEVVLREIDTMTGGRPTAEELLLEQVFPGLPSSRPVFGKPDEIRGIDRAAALGFFAAHYRPDRVALVVIGDVDPQAVLTIARREFEDWQPAAAPAPPTSPSPPTGPASLPTLASPTAEPQPAAQDPAAGSAQHPAAGLARQPAIHVASYPGQNSSAMVVVGFDRPTPMEAAATPLEALGELINAAEPGSWREHLADERRLAWSVGANPLYRSERFPALFLIHAYGLPGVAPADLVAQVGELLVEIGAAPDPDLEGAILQAETRLERSLDDPESLASLLAFHQAVHGDGRGLVRRREALAATTPAAVRDIARRWLRYNQSGLMSEPAAAGRP
jgi:predicted Zn-dependent peptidase